MTAALLQAFARPGFDVLRHPISLLSLADLGRSRSRTSPAAACCSSRSPSAERRVSMEKVRSADGTEIAFERLGEGPPVILVSGASTSRAVHSALAQLLATDFTVFNYDRRGRGDSGDTPPYAVEREIEDIGAVMAAAGGSAAVFGNSSGAVLALRAAAAGLPVTRLALWDPPFMVDPDAPRRQREYLTGLTELLAAGRRGDAMALFMTTVGLPEERIAGMRRAPMWPGLEAVAHTLVYDAIVMGDSTVPTSLASSVKAPTLVLTGGDSGAWADCAAQALTATLPASRHGILDGQNHAVAWDVLAPALKEHFSAQAGERHVDGSVGDAR
jgi:alpha-beta hydrolase superfamily lysophospholipase